MTTIKSIRMDIDTLKHIVSKLEESGCRAICLQPTDKEMSPIDFKMVNHDTSLCGHYLHDITSDNQMIGQNDGHLVCRV